MATDWIPQVTFEFYDNLKPVVARFDQAQASTDGGVVLLKALDVRLLVSGKLHRPHSLQPLDARRGDKRCNLFGCYRNWLLKLWRTSAHPAGIEAVWTRLAGFSTLRTHRGPLRGTGL